ncbi:hypothetical protein SDC9_207249 [bioreactor metagenome]|uniref:Uncharacterized protein n=1 Tax=bioreactor metagenome TaxID=1076179 RepID=A0A645J792_9ZZZZ
MLHAAQQRGRNNGFVGLVLDFRQDSLQLLRFYVFMRTAHQNTERRNEFQEAHHFGRVRLLVDPVDERQICLREMMGDRFIRTQHERFDEALADTAILHIDVQRVAVFVHDDFRFIGFEIDGPAFLTFFQKGFMEYCHIFEHRHKIVVFVT